MTVDINIAGKRITKFLPNKYERVLILNLEELKQEIVKFSKLMYQKGMINVFEGNISVRFEGRYFITAAQQNKETLTTDMILEVDETGRVLYPNPKYRPSSETKMHLAAYRLRKDVNAVVHNHSPFATAFALAGKSIESKACPEMNIIFGKIPLLKYGTPGTDAVHMEFEKYIFDYNAMLMGNHGVITVGSTLLEAYSRAEATENIAKTLLFVKLLGGENELSDEELAVLKKKAEEKKARAAAAMAAAQ